MAKSPQTAPSAPIERSDDADSALEDTGSASRFSANEPIEARVKAELLGPTTEEIREAHAKGPGAPGTGAKSALSMPRAGWKLVFRQLVSEMGSSQTSLSAAGCAFYATLSLFPAITSLISLYGLAFDLQTVEPQLRILHNLLPGAAYEMIHDQIHTLVSQPHASLTIGLISSILVALWSTSASTKSVLSALNMAYNVTETRGFLKFQILALTTTLMAVVGACLTIALMVAAPALVDYLPRYLGLRDAPPPLNLLVAYGAPLIVHLLAPVLMLLFVFLAVSVLYRFAPSRDPASWRWIIPGSCLSTVLWVISSMGFSWYVGHFASYGSTYGPLGAVAAIMMWFFVSAYVVLFGAELNVALEDRARGMEPRINGMPQTDPAVADAVARVGAK